MMRRSKTSALFRFGLANQESAFEIEPIESGLCLFFLCRCLLSLQLGMNCAGHHLDSFRSK